MRKGRCASVAGLLLVALLGCGEDDPPLPPPANPCAELAWLEEEVFETSCLGSLCHSAGNESSTLDLQSEGLAKRLVSAESATCERILVVPGAPERSFFYEKLVSPTPECGDTMPLVSPLPSEHIACVGDWIATADPVCETCDGDICVGLDSDPLNCGACGTVCPEGAPCEGGECECPSGRVLCGGACVDFASDASHCGACDSPCDGGLVCSLSECKAGCDGGLVACSQSCVDTSSDVEHCGGCGIACGANETCDGGSCACEGGADTQTDPNNCGSCGNVCAPGQNCVGGACSCATTSVSFASDVQPIFTQSCTGNACHSGSKAAASLSLSAGDAHGNLVEVATSQCDGNRVRVVPGDPAGSYLLDKMRNMDICFGSKMPKMGVLPASEIETVSSWICAGAPDN